MAVIGLSGLIWWFPVGATCILPGWIINVALVVHSDEWAHWKRVMSPVGFLAFGIGTVLLAHFYRAAG